MRRVPGTTGARACHGTSITLRVIVWGTGAVGREVVRTVLDPRTGLELAGVRVYSADKDGVDQGPGVEAVAAERDHEIFDHVLRAGTTAGQRRNWVGRRDGVPLVEIETLWTVGNEYPAHWPTPRHGWTLTIEGDPSMQAHFVSLASFTRDATMAEHVNSGNA